MTVVNLIAMRHTEVDWRAARDYLLEHWSPLQEDPAGVAHLTDYPSSADFLLAKWLPHYRCNPIDRDDPYKPITSLPLFTERMGALLKELGIPLWGKPTRNGPGSNWRDTDKFDDYYYLLSKTRLVNYE